MNTESKRAKSDSSRPWVRGPYFVRLVIYFSFNFTFVTFASEIVSLFHPHPSWIGSSMLGRAVFALIFAGLSLDSQLRAENHATKPNEL
ncbi:hypothetical protein GC207_15140 [bacterium]|nr:hypothetical protein [bacterium]